MERNQTVDILRGIATLAVLAGHAIQRGLITGFDQNIVFRLIYAFHMPLFILLSGYTLYLSKPKYDKSFLWKKIKRLLFPTILWSYILYFIKDLWFVGIQPFVTFPTSILSYTKQLFFHPDFIYWFLYILLIFSLIFYITKKLPDKYFIPGLITFYILFWMVPVEYFGVYWLRIYFPLYIFGYFFAHYKEKLLPQLKYYLLPCILSTIYCFPKVNLGGGEIYVYSIS